MQIQPATERKKRLRNYRKKIKKQSRWREQKKNRGRNDGKKQKRGQKNMKRTRGREQDKPTKETGEKTIRLKRRLGKTEGDLSTFG